MIYLLAAFLIALPAHAEKISLKDAIERAMQGNGELKAQRLQVDQAQQDLRRARSEFMPKIDAVAGVGPITRADGNAAFSTEYKHEFGRMIIGKVELTQPLYTWGRKTNYEAAANSGIKVKEAEVAAKAQEVVFSVKEVFYGYQFANSLFDFVASGKKEFEKVYEDRKKKKSVAGKDSYRLELFLREVEAKEAEIKKNFDLVKEGFALRTGTERGTFLPDNEWLEAEFREMRTADHYVSLARANRSEFQQLREGINAKYNLARAEKKGAFPFFAFLGTYELADTNVRPHQPGVFSYDPYNRETWALGVGLKWSFEWDLQLIKAAKYRKEAEELEAKQMFANQGIEADVRRAYLELVEADAKLRAGIEGYKTGKKWLTGELMAFGSGLGGAEGIVEAYGARAQTAKNYFEAAYKYHMAWAGLSRAVGKEVDPVLLK